MAKIAGQFGYRSGTGSQTLQPSDGTLPKNARIMSIKFTGGTLTINGGNTITGPFDKDYNLGDLLTAPVLVFAGTTTYYADFVTNGGPA